jgi:predicted transcriptional regulator
MSTNIVDIDEIRFPPYFSGMSTISPEQCRAGRGWLGWTQDQLADKAGVGLSTVKDFEKGTRTPIQNNRAALERALKDAGIACVFGKDGTARGVEKVK